MKSLRDNLQNILDQSKKFDIDSVKMLLEETLFETESDFDLLINSITKSSAFIEKRGATFIVRDNFVKEILDIFKTNANVKNLIEYRVNQIYAMEALYSFILKERENSIFIKYSIQNRIISIFKFIDSHFKKISSHCTQVILNSGFFHEGMSKDSSDTFDEIDVDTQIAHICSIITSNIKVECYQNKLFKKNDLAVVPITDFESSEIVDIEKTIILPLLWRLIEHHEHLWMFMDVEIKKFSNVKKVEEYLKTNNIVNDEIVEVLYLGDHPLLESYALIAQERMKRIMFNHAAQIKPVIDQSKITTQKECPLPPEKWLTLDEAMDTHFFHQFFHIDPIQDKRVYGELYLTEWIRGLSFLKKIANAKFEDATNGTFYMVTSKDDLCEQLSHVGLSREKANSLIWHLSFKKDSIDIYDAPILEVGNNKIIIMLYGFVGMNMINTLSSIFSRNDFNIDHKGTLFEKEVLSFFKNNNLNCKSITKIIQGEEYQYDCIIEWENYIFIIECKNRSIPNTTPYSLSRFSDKLKEYVSQVKRLESCFRLNLSLFAIEFQSDLQSKKIVPIILNALPFSLDVDVEGVYFTDYSLVNRFFQEKHLCKKITRNGKVIKSDIIHTLWKSDKPTAEDFYLAIKKPFQVTDALSRVRSQNYSLPFNKQLIIHQSFYLESLDFTKDLNG